MASRYLIQLVSDGLYLFPKGYFTHIHAEILIDTVYWDTCVCIGLWLYLFVFKDDYLLLLLFLVQDNAEQCGKQSNDKSRFDNSISILILALLLFFLFVS